MKTYANLRKWPMAEAEFVRSISHGGSQRRTTVADSISCRQMYLRSYTFTRKESECEDTSDQRKRGGKKKKAAKKG
ncbi:unnamed protein product [Thlaspi arvense]|uniref:Uncharacterized protein n=1 Tax=Thlaspi arvense TaxID=13288 RepID=A0AAU9SK98_THLAR|nr:unnamed protein product [Thlaspi arvense]